MAEVVRRGWDRTGLCCKPDCGRPRATGQPTPSLLCQHHLDAWHNRLEALAELVTPPRAVTFLPPPPMADVELCARCHTTPRDFPDHLCEECRRG